MGLPAEFSRRFVAEYIRLLSLKFRTLSVSPFFSGACGAPDEFCFAESTILSILSILSIRRLVVDMSSICRRYVVDMSSIYRRYVVVITTYISSLMSSLMSIYPSYPSNRRLYIRQTSKIAVGMDLYTSFNVFICRRVMRLGKIKETGAKTKTYY